MALMMKETGRVGKSGVFTIPAALRERFDLQDGSMLIAEEREDGIFLRPAEVSASISSTEDLVALRSQMFLKYAGSISNEDLDLMESAIEEHCERIDHDGW